MKTDNPTVNKFLKNNEEKDYLKRVKNGIKVLDKEFGRKVWLKKINLKTLDLSNSDICVCGQVFGDYFGMIFGSKNYDSLLDDWIYEHGFSDEYDNNYDLLTYVWWKELSKLKK